MKFLTVVAAFVGVAMAAPPIATRDGSDITIIHTGTVKDMKVTKKENALNSTYHDPQTKVVAPSAVSELAGISIPFEFVNSSSGKIVNAYLVGLDPQKRVVCIRQDGTLVFRSSGGSAEPLPVKESIKISLPSKGQKLSMDLPIPPESGRIHFAEGELQFAMCWTDWEFVELTFTKGGAIHANICYVDFIDMILSMDLTTSDGTPKQVTKGLAAGSIKTPWGKICIANNAGAAVGVLFPNDDTVIDPNGFANYWDSYANQVGQVLEAALIVKAQGDSGNVSCKVSGNQLSCAGDDLGFQKPSAADIWGCNGGPFENRGNSVHLAAVARICADFICTTLFLPGGNVQPS